MGTPELIFLIFIFIATPSLIALTIHLDRANKKSLDLLRAKKQSRVMAMPEFLTLDPAERKKLDTKIKSLKGS